MRGLLPKAPAQARLKSQSVNSALQRFDIHLKNLREHIKKRRDFLLAQDEIKNTPSRIRPDQPARSGTTASK